MTHRAPRIHCSGNPETARQTVDLRPEIESEGNFSPHIRGGKQRYRDGSYLKATGGTWHLEDSAFKAHQIVKMMRRNALRVRNVCEIGCGAGGVLASLQERMDNSIRFVGFDVSPQAHEISSRFSGSNLTFRLGDAFESQATFDLVLALDVVEHIEDYLEFLRKTRRKGNYKIFHVPLEIQCSGILRDRLTYSWRKVGHVHFFTLSTALEALRFTGHEILDHFLTPVAFEAGRKSVKTRAANVLRRILPARLCATLLGGYSLLALTR